MQSKGVFKKITRFHLFKLKIFFFRIKLLKKSIQNSTISKLLIKNFYQKLITIFRHGHIETL
jgi:hypothetical protein